MENDNYKNKNEALLGFFRATISMKYKNHLGSSFVGRTNRSFQEIFNFFLYKYSKFGPLDLQTNKE